MVKNKLLQLFEVSMVILFLASLVNVQVVEATEYTYDAPCNGITMVFASNPTTNYNGQINIADVGSGAERIGLNNFTLPINISFTNATLWINTANAGSGVLMDVNVYPTTSTFTFSTVTYNTKPTKGSLHTIFRCPASDYPSGSWKTFDVTAFITPYVNNNVTGFYGFSYTGDNGSQIVANSALGNQFIRFTYTAPPAPTPTPTATPVPSPTPFIGLDWSALSTFYSNVSSLFSMVAGAIITFFGMVFLMKVSKLWMVGVILLVAGFFMQILIVSNYMVLIIFALETILYAGCLYNLHGRKNK